MKPTLNTSVVRLAADYAAAGDLHPALDGPRRPRDAVLAHGRVQRKRPAGYLRETPAAYVAEGESFDIAVAGRIDGVIQEGGVTVIEEIKTTTADPRALLAADHPVHWGQLKIYAFIYAAVHRLPAVRARLTACRLPGDEEASLDRDFSFAELSAFFNDLIDRMTAREQAAAQWRQTRGASLKDLPFPRPAFRPGQRDLAKAVYVAVKNGKHLLAQAPTGLGKTLGVLFPVLRAMGEGRVDKALYLTARNTGAAAAMDALNRLRAGGARVRSLALTARDQVCLAPDRACTGEDCPFAAGYYDRREAAAAELLAEEALDRRVVEAVARRRSVCPFELSRDAAPWVDVIIGDYNYVFDPQVGLKRVLEREEKRCFLVDEAHNLPDRAREMYSASVRGASVVEAVESRGKTCSKTAAAGRRVLDWLESAAPERPGDGYFVEPEPPEEWLALLSSAARTVEQAWAEGREVDEGVRGFYYQAVDFLRVAEGFDPSSAFYYAREADGPTARLFCLDPAPRLTQAWKKAASVVVFSATLSPRYYYQTELGLAEDAAGLALASPFPPDNRFLVVADRVDTRYRFRERSKGRLAETIAAALSGKSGNFLLFFPSYQYLALTAPALDQYLPEADILAQAPDMGAADREAFLARLTAAGAGLRVGMAVLGGVFAEGVDLAGGRLAGAVVVGVGLPGVGPERELLRDYYDRVRGDGFRCAYLYPGMRRVIQAAGRIIRAEDERGVIVLIDRRFTLPDYRACFPPDWRPMTAGEPRRLAAMVRGFAAS